MRVSVRIGRNFSPALKVLSSAAPSLTRLSLVRTNAPPLPGLTCWKSMILKTTPSTSMWVPFLNWFVEIMRASMMTHGGADLPEALPPAASNIRLIAGWKPPGSG